jgi:hypothetical protein
MVYSHLLKLPLINASERNTESILRRPPLTGITTNDTCALTMSRVLNVCVLRREAFRVLL